LSVGFENEEGDIIEERGLQLDDTAVEWDYPEPEAEYLGIRYVLV
jgi:hypothetical protein